MKMNWKKILYGGDYNPDQWLNHPEILKEDLRLMKKAHVNTVTLGMFSWAKLEPEQDRFDFDWLEEIINRLYANGISTILGTPSGARPRWLADKYPEVLRVNEDRSRQLYGMRENHCYSSPAYRERVRLINRRLAGRFDAHPAVILWHISNEYSGECHCPLCQDAFRAWVKERYHTIEEVNRCWNTAFWGHDYQSFDQIESPSSLGEISIDGLSLDWKRFSSHQTTDFCRWEIEALREGGAGKATTTNLMYHYKPVNYHELADVIDVISWDNYPSWDKGSNILRAADTAMQHDIMRSLKREPFLLMESCPGATNWKDVSKLTRPGMIQAQGFQALAHGADSVLYFQIRQGRGGYEKFHAALISHSGREDERNYRECQHLGEMLGSLSDISSTDTRAEVAILFDWENMWAMENAMGPRNENLYYKESVQKSYDAFRKQGINVDVIDMTQSLDRYSIVAAPMLYMFRPGFPDKIKSFVKNGGIFIMTYWSGIVDEHDLCYLGGTPGELMELMGLRSTEIDALYDGEYNTLIPEGDFLSEFTAKKSGVMSQEKKNRDISYRCEHLCQLMKVDTAIPFMRYGRDFYAGMPAVTVNQYGKGKAFYIGADAEAGFYDDLYAAILDMTDIENPLGIDIPEGIEVTCREDEKQRYIFVQNFNAHAVCLDIPQKDYKVLYSEYVRMNSDGSPAFYHSNASQSMMQPLECRIYMEEKR